MIFSIEDFKLINEINDMKIYSYCGEENVNLIVEPAATIFSKSNGTWYVRFYMGQIGKGHDSYFNSDYIKGFPKNPPLKTVIDSLNNYILTEPDSFWNIFWHLFEQSVF